MYRQREGVGQQYVPVGKASGALVWQLIRGPGQQCAAVAAGNHRRHHSGLVAALLLQKLQVQLCGHSDLVPGLLGGLGVLV